MLRDLTNQKKIDKQTVVNAIKSLQAKAWDINPYTVADEAKIARSSLYRNPELMDLINEAKGVAPSAESGSTGEILQQLQQLEERNRELELIVEQLHEQNQNLAAAQQSSWQQGYQAGYNEAQRQ